MQFLSAIVTALTVSLLSLSASANHVQRRQHQGLSRRMDGDLAHLEKRFSGSRWSWYDTQTGNAGSCGRMLQNSEFVVAMNVPQYQAGNCYKSITMSWRGKTTKAQIVDMCPGCPYGGLDLSPALFQFFTGLGTGIISDGEWWFDGEGPAPPPPPAPTKTTSKWTPPPAPTSTKAAPKPTTTWSPKPTPSSTKAPEPTTTHTPKTSSSTSSSSSSTISSTSTSSAAAESTPASLTTQSKGNNVQGIFNLAVALGELVVAGAN